MVVEPEGELAAEPTFRKQLHLLSLVSDAHNFATGDSRTLSATLPPRGSTAADRDWMRWFYLEAMAYLLLTQRYVVSVHAACVAHDGAGILICGKSGSGKSTLSFACARAGFTYVSDDSTWFLTGSEDRVAIGKPHQLRFRHDVARHFPELAGYIASAHPNGKLSIEVPTSLFPRFAPPTAARFAAWCFWIAKAAALRASNPCGTRASWTSLLADMPSYGAEVNAAQEKTIYSLAALPSWQLTTVRSRRPFASYPRLPDPRHLANLNLPASIFSS